MSDRDDGSALEQPGQSEGPPPMPGWVKALLLTILAIAVLVVILVGFFGGEHGPMRHGSSSSGPVIVSAEAQ